MPETFTATQATVLNTAAPHDGDAVIDPGEQVTTTVTITNNSTTSVNATGVQFTEDLAGMTLVNQAGDDINVSPIAFDDTGYTTAGNVSFTAAVSVLANDTEPLGPEGLALNAGTVIQNTGVALPTSGGGSVTLNAIDGTFTYVSAVGFEGTDTFTYTLRDTGLDGVAGNADDLTSGTGTVSITVGPSVWFIDNTAPGSLNLGTQAHPFTSIAAFNAAQGTANGPDAGDVIYLREGTYTEADGINLATGQTLIGQGQNLVVNGVTIETATSAPTIQVTGAGGEGVLLAQNNTLSGFNISTTNAAADGIEDGGGTVGTLTISNVSISGTGQAIDIDQGGTLNVTIDSLSSTGSSEQGVQLAATGAALTGTFTVNGGSISGSTGSAFLVGDGAGGANTGGTIAITYAGSVSSTGGVRTVDIQDRAASAGSVTLSGNLSHASGNGTAIFLDDNAAGTITFSGATKTLNGGTATAVNLTDNTGATKRLSIH